MPTGPTPGNTILGSRAKTIPRLQFLPDARCDDWRFVDFQSDAMPDKFGFLCPTPHEIAGKSRFLHHIHSQIVQILTRYSRTSCLRYCILHIETNTVGHHTPPVAADQRSRHGSCRTYIRKSFRPISTIKLCPACKRVPLTPPGKDGSMPPPPRAKIIRAGHSSIVPRQQAAHKDFHTAAKDTEDAQTTLQTHQTLYFDRKLAVGHAGAINGRYLTVSFRMGGSTAAEHTDFPPLS